MMSRQYGGYSLFRLRVAELQYVRIRWRIARARRHARDGTVDCGIRRSSMRLVCFCCWATVLTRGRKRKMFVLCVPVTKQQQQLVRVTKRARFCTWTSCDRCNTLRFVYTVIGIERNRLVYSFVFSCTCPALYLIRSFTGVGLDEALDSEIYPVNISGGVGDMCGTTLDENK